MNTQVLGISVDSVPCLKAWADSFGGIQYPLLSDFYPHGQLAKLYGVLRSEGYSERALFVLDKQGVIQYVDVHDIDKQPDNEELFRVLAVLEPEAARREAERNAATPAFVEPAADVVMYCTPWCPGCRRMRAFFKDHQIAFAEVDITRNREASQRLRRWANGTETTPTFNIQGKILVDPSEDELRRVLGIQ